MKVGIVTGTRADYGLLEPLIRKVKNHRKMELQLYVTGMHLADRFGQTEKQIKHPVTCTIPVPIEATTTDEMGKATSYMLEGFLDEFGMRKPQIVFVLGDRIEMFAAAMAAFFLRIPVAHIHAGDRSGGLDDRLRDSITQLSTYFFTATSKASTRVTRMTGKVKDVMQVGAIGLDSLMENKLSKKRNLGMRYKIPYGKDWILMVMHPDTLHLGRAWGDTDAILRQLMERDAIKILIYPNSDAKHSVVIDEIEKYREMKDFRIFESVPHSDFLSMLKHCRFIIGNSSCALLEAPTLGIPAVNVGDRQKGRERGANVLDARGAAGVERAINKIYKDKAFLKQVAKRESPYGNGTASDKIMTFLEEMIQ